MERADTPFPSRPGWARFGPALLLGALAVILRLGLIAAPPPDLSYHGSVWVEEWLRGNIAVEVLRGPVIPLEDHPIPFWGGMLLVGLMAVPAFAVLGPSLFALRLATLPFAFLLAFSGFLLLDRLVSRRAAWVGGLLLAFTPPGFTFASVLAQGTHCEQTAIGVFLLWLYAEHRARHAARGTPSLALAFAVGFVFGFHVWFGAALVLPLLVVFEFARDRLFFVRRDFRAALVGLFAGALPFLHYQFVYGGRPLENYGHGPVGMLTPKNWDAIAAKLARLPGQDFPLSFWFQDAGPLGGRVLGLAAALALGALFVVALVLERRSLGAFVAALQPWKRARPDLDPLVLVLVWPAGWLALYALTPFGLGPGEWIIDYRYLLPPQVFLLLGAALAIERVARARPLAGRFVVAISVLFALACAASALARADVARAREHFDTPGARPAGVAKRMLWRHGSDPESLSSFVEAVLERRAPAEQDELFYELAASLKIWLAQSIRFGRAPRGADDDPRAALLSARERVPERCRAWFDVPLAGPPALLPEDPAQFRAEPPR